MRYLCQLRLVAAIATVTLALSVVAMAQSGELSASRPEGQAPTQASDQVAQTGESTSTTAIYILGEALNVPFSAKRVQIVSSDPDELSFVREISQLDFAQVADTVVAMIPLRYLTMLQDRGISYSEVIPEEEGAAPTTDRSETLLNVAPVAAPEGCLTTNMRYGDAANYYTGDYAIPGDAGGRGVTLSPGSFSGGTVEFDENLSDYTPCVNTATSITVNVLSQEVCFLGACVDPWIACYNWSTQAWDYNWHVPKGSGWHSADITPNPGNYMSATFKRIYWGVSAAAQNKTYVWQSYLYVCYSETSPVCAVAPTNIPFPDTRVGSYSSRTLTITNTGCGTLSGTVSESSSQFRVTANDGSLSYSLTRNQSETFTVYFEPTECGYHATSIETGASICSDVSVSGNGIADPVCVVSPTSIPFPSTRIGNSSSQTFAITNTV